MRTAAVLLLAALGCASGPGGPWAWWGDPAGIQWPLAGDWTCSSSPDVAPQCCAAHDLSYWAGGTEQDRVTADYELAACMALWGVPEPILAAYLLAVRWGGASSWHLTGARARGPSR